MVKFLGKLLNWSMRFDFISNKFLRFHNDLKNFCGMPLYQNDLLIQNLAIFPIESLQKYNFTQIKNIEM